MGKQKLHTEVQHTSPEETGKLKGLGVEGQAILKVTLNA
jgi:hypothetical protein